MCVRERERERVSERKTTNLFLPTDAKKQDVESLTELRLILLKAASRKKEKAGKF